MAESNPADAQRPERTETAADGDTQRQRSPLYRPPPPMRVVTKGWWTLVEKQADIKELEKKAREQI